jgi:O-antigen ligase
MKQLFSTKDTIADRISLLHLVFFAAVLPFDRLYSELALISLLIHTLIYLRKENLRGMMQPSFLIGTAGIYLLTCLWTIGSPYQQQAFFEWEIQLAFLLFPIIFSVNPIDLQKARAIIFPAMGFSCTVTILYLYAAAFRVIFFYHLPATAIFSDAFINHNFSLPIGLHATYFSLYIGLSLMAFLLRVLYSKEKTLRVLFICSIPVMAAGLIQLSSKSVLIAVCLLLLFVLPLQLARRKRIVFLTGSLLIGVILAGLVSVNSSFRNRYLRDFLSDLSLTVQNPQQLAPRAVRWQTGWELIKTAPFAGHGSGSEIALLKEGYFQHHLYNAYINELNVHNQYLSFLIKMGIPGLLVYLLVLVNAYRQAIRRKDLLFICFLVMISIVSFSENIFDVNKGIFFMAFFFTLFSYSNTVKPVNCDARNV